MSVPAKEHENISADTSISISTADVEFGSDNTIRSGDTSISEAGYGYEAGEESSRLAIDAKKDDLQEPRSTHGEEIDEEAVQAPSQITAYDESNLLTLFVPPELTEEELREREEDYRKAVERYSKVENFPDWFVTQMQRKSSISYEVSYIYWYRKLGLYEFLFDRMRFGLNMRVGNEHRKVSKQQFASFTTSTKDKFTETYFNTFLNANAETLDCPEYFFAETEAGNRVKIPHDYELFPIARMSSQSSLGPRSSRASRTQYSEKPKAQYQTTSKANNPYDSPRSQHWRAQPPSTIMSGNYGFDRQRDTSKRRYR